MIARLTKDICEGCDKGVTVNFFGHTVIHELL